MKFLRSTGIVGQERPALSYGEAQLQSVPLRRLHGLMHTLHTRDIKGGALG
jgi:hypothetical protein